MYGAGDGSGPPGPCQIVSFGISNADQLFLLSEI